MAYLWGHLAGWAGEHLWFFGGLSQMGRGAPLRDGTWSDRYRAEIVDWLSGHVEHHLAFSTSSEGARPAAGYEFQTKLV